MTDVLGDHQSHGPKAGYSLIELLVVLAVLSVITAIAVVSLLNALDKAKQRATMADMRSISKALKVYSIDFGYLPDDSGGIDSLPAVLEPYQTSVLPIQDHWRNPYVYTTDGNGNYTIESFGKDGVDGQDVTVDTRFDFDLDIVIVNGNFTAAPE
jgi:general secretion pathway protein G